jgi:hypothetical protein
VCNLSTYRHVCACQSFFTTLNVRVSKVHEFKGNDFSPLNMPGLDYSKAFVGPVTKTTPYHNGICILGRSQTSPEHLGAFWHKTPMGFEGSVRFDFAILKDQHPVANLMKTQVCLAVPPDIFMIEGTAAAQGTRTEWYPGGGLQVYIPKDVVDALWPASKAFLERDITPASYRTFIDECIPAKSVQVVWWRKFERLQAVHDKEARQSNMVRAAQNTFDAAIGHHDGNSVDGKELRSSEKQLQLVIAAETQIAAAIKGTTGEHKVRAERLAAEAKTKRLDLVSDIVDNVARNQTLEEHVEIKCFDDIATGNLLLSADVPDEVRQLLRAGDSRVVTGERLGSKYEGRAFRVHRVGNWFLEVTLTFDHLETKTEGKTTTITYYYLLRQRWVR